jgi:putative sterol carrier protein
MALNASSIKASRHEGFDHVGPGETEEEKVALLSVEGSLAFTHDGEVSELPQDTHFYVAARDQEGFKAAIFDGDVAVSGSLTISNGEAEGLLVEGGVEIDGDLRVEGDLVVSGTVKEGLFLDDTRELTQDFEVVHKKYVDEKVGDGLAGELFQIQPGDAATGEGFGIDGADQLVISGTVDQIEVVLSEDNLAFKLADDVTLVGNLTAVDATLSGELSAVSGSFSGPLAADNATLAGDLTAIGATLSGDLAAVSGSFSGDIEAVDARLTGDLEAVGATLTGDLAADNATLAGDLTAVSGSFSGDIEAVDATLTGDLIAVGATLSGDLAADNATLAGDLTAVSGSFSGDIEAVDATLTGDLVAVGATLSGDLAADNATLTGDLAAISGSFSGDIAAVDANLSGDLRVEGDLVVSGTVKEGLFLDGTRELTQDFEVVHKKYVDEKVGDGLAGELFQIKPGDATTGAAFGIDGADELIISGTADQIEIAFSEDNLVFSLADNVTLVGDLAAVDATLSGDLAAVSGSFSGDIEAVDATFTGDLVVQGDMTVQGTTTVLDTVNVTIKDPFVLLASGAEATNTDGGIIIFKGSSDTNQEDLVIGRVAADTWGVKKIDSQGGEITSLSGGTLVNFRADELQVGGADNYLGMLSGDLHLHADDSLIICAADDGRITIKSDDGATKSDWLVFDIDAGAILPAEDSVLNLGSFEKRFNNIFTGDLHLRNDRGNWTLIEEENYITFRNNDTGKRYKMLMEDITGTGTYGPGNDGIM